MTTEVTTCYCLLIMKLYPARFQPFLLPALLLIEDLIKHTFWSCISGRVVSRDLDATTQMTQIGILPLQRSKAWTWPTKPLNCFRCYISVASQGNGWLSAKQCNVRTVKSNQGSDPGWPPKGISSVTLSLFFWVLSFLPLFSLSVGTATPADFSTSVD